MEGGKVTDFIDAFTYQSVSFVFKSEKFFSDGIVVNSDGKYYFFIIKVDSDGNFLEDVYEFWGDSISDCVFAFENAPIWDGKTFYEVEKKMTWVDW